MKAKLAPTGQHLHGAYSDVSQLISGRFAAKDLKLHQRNKALSLLAGPNKTNFRGRGIEFEEVRAYQPGDDIRSIDWRVTARSDKAYTKLFREERERPVLIVTDQRQSMFFGSHYCFKSVLACYASSVIAWAGLSNGDRVGGLCFGNKDHEEIRPRRSRQAVLGLIHQMLDYNQRLSKDTQLASSVNQSMQQALNNVRRIAKPGSAIFIISDFAGFEHPSTNRELTLLAKHCEISCIAINDPMERELPPAGQYTITDGKQRQTLFTGSKNYRQQYRQAFEQLRTQHKQQCAKLGIPFIEMLTTEPPLSTLYHFYGKGR